ncbi:MAG: two-component system LytT family response regulator [Arenicella sp.]|jgi:two-component system LytT family response regulator
MIKTCLIIDDEKLARNLIAEFLEEFDNLEVLGQCAKGKEAVVEINKHKPDLIFLDVQIPDFNGFEVLEMIAHKPVVIFCTAFDQYALKAFEQHAIDYLLKPIDQDRFRQAVNRALEQIEKNKMDFGVLLDTVKNANQSFPSHVIVQKSNKMLNLPVAEIMYLEASGDYTVLHTKDDEYVSSKTLTSWLEQLDSSFFVRIHRSNIINFRYLKEVEKHFKGGLMATMQNGKQLSVSRTYAKNIKDRLV